MEESTAAEMLVLKVNKDLALLFMARLVALAQRKISVSPRALSISWPCRLGRGYEIILALTAASPALDVHRVALLGFSRLTYI